MTTVGISRRAFCALIAAVSAFLLFAPSAFAVIQPASYPDMTTYTCRSDALPIHPGQNLNLFGGTKTCPNAQVKSGPGDTSPFAAGSDAEGFITRFKPSMVEIQGDGSTRTPSVWDLHLHHVVWLKPNGGPTFASGEEKTEAKMPHGYGIRVDGDGTWGLNYMIHNLTAEGGRSIYITWEIDWVPVSPQGSQLTSTNIQWLDVAGAPQVYPVFDAERGFDRDGDGKFVFPDDVPTNPNQPGYEERGKISESASWTVPPGGRTLVFGAGHLHPGGTSVDLEVARDGPDAGTVDGDDPSEVQPLFHSGAKYYEPAGAVSWDVSMEATRPSWRISVKAGDTLSIDATYNVKKASWYESMGIMPLAVANVDDSAARDPFDDAAEVQEMYEQGGVLTHGRLPENIDKKADKDLGLPDPRKLKSGKRVPGSGIDIDGFRFMLGGYSAFRNYPSERMSPPTIKPGGTVSFTNTEALPGQPDEEQAWHSITSCEAPCNRGSGIGYPLANGPVKFDSGQLGYGTFTSTEVTTGSNTYTTPPLPKAGKTYTYFCRIHPFMRGSIRTTGKKN